MQDKAGKLRVWEKLKDQRKQGRSQEFQMRGAKQPFGGDQKLIGGII